LDAAFWALGGTALGLGVIGALVAPLAGLDRDLVFWALAFCACNGAFEYQLALLRARFDDRAYALLIFAKNILSLALTAGVAWATASPGLTLAGTAASVALSTLLLRARLKDPHARQAQSNMATIRETLAYALPLAFSLILFALIPLANRALGARFSDFAEAGQLALAQDVGLKLVLTIGTAMDQLLFQLAVREHETGGRRSGQAQVASNMTLMAALFLPALVGTWLVLPSFEVLIIPSEFRGDFANALTILLPGLVCYGLMTFALAPAFQIAQRTWPVIAASVSACLADAALLTFLPPTWDVDMLALAQSGALICGFLTLLALSPLAKPTWPRAQDVIALITATVAMTGFVWPLRDMTPGVTALITQAALGGCVYIFVLIAFDFVGLRQRFGVRSWLSFK
jgi:O-antigen/teichoic acid export membrane protein